IYLVAPRSVAHHVAQIEELTAADNVATGHEPIATRRDASHRMTRALFTRSYANDNHRRVVLCRASASNPTRIEELTTLKAVTLQRRRVWRSFALLVGNFRSRSNCQ